MRFVLGLPTDRVDLPDEFVTADAVAELATAAERLGFDAVFVTEHPIPEQRWLDRGGHHALDPFVALSFAAASTRSIRLLTNLLVLGYKNPFITAKSIASLDRLSGGRLIVGVGAGYMQPEFHALGSDFSRRNELCDEAIVAMKAAWSGDGVEVAGPDGAPSRHLALPLPLQEPHPPIWVGGNSKRAIRRAVDLCQGWMPFPAAGAGAQATRTAPLATVADLGARLRYLREYAEQVGRSEPVDIAFAASFLGGFASEGFETARLIDELAALSDVGVQWTSAQLETMGSHTIRSRAHCLELMEAYASEVIAKVR